MSLEKCNNCNKECLTQVDGAVGIKPRQNLGAGLVFGDFYIRPYLGYDGTLVNGYTGLEGVVSTVVNCPEYSRIH